MPFLKKTMYNSASFGKIWACFPEKINKLFNCLDYVRTYIDVLLVISNKSLEDHIKKLDKVLSKWKLSGFKVNAEKSFFARNEL